MIEINQELHLKNLLSFRKNLTQAELQKELIDIDSFIKENGLTVIGPKISTTYSVTQSMMPTMDIEILIPVDKIFSENHMYNLKKELKLTNCLKLEHRGNPQSMQQNIILIQQYIKDKGLMPISSLYTVSLNEAKTPDELENYVAELYLSISPNIT
ncbi:effector-binding domain-containing protein [Clostridium collagenovorans DSM 3089]|uniref:Effector-binding domain-containing protein n=1 Tax=Clostridium collagenovorans DSM 3089 TaxID=1121306 RepID=A0A1M5X5Z6_9CLOT|nr:transcriptional regulator [Clostridium collagenovorans]SHH95062.1 effector-binding domain-containing protein [Clostridium collagenovorans DSM 3089]